MQANRIGILVMSSLFCLPAMSQVEMVRVAVVVPGSSQPTSTTMWLPVYRIPSRPENREAAALVWGYPGFFGTFGIPIAPQTQPSVVLLGPVPQTVSVPPPPPPAPAKPVMREYHWKHSNQSTGESGGYRRVP